VNQHLKKLEEEGIIKKQYVEGRILNVLQPHETLSLEAKKSLEPVLFAVDAWPYVLGLKMHYEVLSRDKVAITIKKEKEDLKERIEAVGRRIGVFYLFVLLKALEENNRDWLTEAGKLIGIVDLLVWNSLGLSMNDTSPSAHQKRVFLMDGNVGLIPIPKVGDLPKKEETSKLKNILEQIFPKEIKELEDVLRGQQNYADATFKN
jgi:DNA-binding transcriptional ArsR family regulator